MKHFYANGKLMAFWKGLSKGDNNNSALSLKPRLAHTFFLDKESMQRNQGVGCSPKFSSCFLKNKNSPPTGGSNSLFFFTSPHAKLLTATHPKAILRTGASKYSTSIWNDKPLPKDSFGSSLTGRRLSIGNAVGFLRDTSDNCSAVVRQSFGWASASSRRTAEAHPKKTRSVPEAVSNKSRSAVEQFSKKTKRKVEEMDRAMCEFVRYEKASNPITTQAQPKDDPRTAQEIPNNHPITRLEIPKDGLRQTLSKTFLRNVYTRGPHNKKLSNIQPTDRENTVLKQGRGTAVPLLSYCSPTKVVLQSYYGGTKELLNTYVLVTPQYNSSRSVVVPKTKGSVSIAKYVKLIASKCLRPIAYGLMLILVSMFSLSDAWAQSAETRAAEGQQMDTTGHRIVPFSKEAVIKRIRANPKYNLATYPLRNYEIDRKIISGISLGQSIPEEVWDMRLRIVRADGSEDTCTLSAFNNDKFLILDFWTTWCQPCVASVNKWENILSKKKDKVQLVNVHLGFDYQAPPFIADRGWHSPTVIDMGARLLNAYFFTTEAFGKIVWIKSGKLYAITTASQLSEEELEAIVMGNGKVQSTTEGVYSN